MQRPNENNNPLPDAGRRDRLLSLGDREILGKCRLDTARGTGRGGQKRNRTDSAVRVTHIATGLAAACDDTRSQASNRRIALRRLRREMALKWRCQPPSDRWQAAPAPGRRDAEYPQWLARTLDVLAHHTWRVAPAAAQLEVSTGRLVRCLARDPAAWQMVNAERSREGMPKLRK